MYARPTGKPFCWSPAADSESENKSRIHRTVSRLLAAGREGICKHVGAVRLRAVGWVDCDEKCVYVRRERVICDAILARNIGKNI